MNAVFNIFKVFLAGICVGTPLSHGLGLELTQTVMLCVGISLSLAILITHARDQ